MDGQLSLCRLGPVRFYVREALRYDHFNITSGERYGIRRGQLPTLHVQVLELCCMEEDWGRIAKAVQEADALHRPVRRNRRFTLAWARRLLPDPAVPRQRGLWL